MWRLAELSRVLILARYDENVSWAIHGAAPCADVIVLNRGAPLAGVRQEMRAENVGRESFLYLDWVLRHYEGLPARMTFCQADPNYRGVSARVSMEGDGDGDEGDSSSIDETRNLLTPRSRRASSVSERERLPVAVEPFSLRSSSSASGYDARTYGMAEPRTGMCAAHRDRSASERKPWIPASGAHTAVFSALSSSPSGANSAASSRPAASACVASMCTTTSSR